MSIGPELLGEYASRQLASARRDPRLDRDASALGADYLDYLEEAERARQLAIWGTFELSHSLEREERRLGKGSDDPSLTQDERASLQAAWERAELARAEVESQHPHINAITLIGMFGNLDGYVERLVPSVRSMRKAIVRRGLGQRLQQVASSTPDIEAALQTMSPELLAHVLDVGADVLLGMQEGGTRLRGAGAERWESVLRSADLAAAPGAIPTNLDGALAEVKALRDVLVHRGGRVDDRALRECPALGTRLGLAEGEIVRVNRKFYRRYSSALRAYGADVTRRVCAQAGVEIEVDLFRWEEQVYAGA